MLFVQVYVTKKTRLMRVFSYFYRLRAESNRQMPMIYLLYSLSYPRMARITLSVSFFGKANKLQVKALCGKISVGVFGVVIRMNMHNSEEPLGQ